MKELGIREILVTCYSLMPTVLLYVKVTRVRLLSACLSVYMRETIPEGLNRFLLHAI